MKMDPKGRNLEVVNWSGSRWVQVAGWCDHGNEHSDSI